VNIAQSKIGAALKSPKEHGPDLTPSPIVPEIGASFFQLKCDDR